MSRDQRDAEDILLSGESPTVGGGVQGEGRHDAGDPGRHDQRDAGEGKAG